MDRNLGTDLQARRIELDRNPETDLQPRRLELDRNIGTDPHQIQVFDERSLGDYYQKSYHRRYGEDWKSFMSTCPTSNQGYTQTTIQLKALQTRMLKMENCEKRWPHRCVHIGEEKFMVLLKLITREEKA